MHLKGKIKLKVWGWLLKKDQVSEDTKRGKLLWDRPSCWFTNNMSDWFVFYQETFDHGDVKMHNIFMTLKGNNGHF